MSSQVQIPDIAAKPLTGKYDGRYKRVPRKTGVRALSKPGPKPAWVKHLTKNQASKIIQDYDSIASWPQIYAEAWAKKQLALCVQMREYADSRLLGKPYTAENPNASKMPSVLIQDNRLQQAITNLLPAQPKAKGKRKAPKLLEGRVVDTPDQGTEPTK
jgi:hypothetical protein